MQKFFIVLSSVCCIISLLLTGIEAYTEWGLAQGELIRVWGFRAFLGYAIFLFAGIGPIPFREFMRLRAKKLAKSGKPEPAEQDVEDHEL